MTTNVNVLNMYVLDSHLAVQYNEQEKNIRTIIFHL